MNYEWLPTYTESVKKKVWITFRWYLFLTGLLTKISKSGEKISIVLISCFRPRKGSKCSFVSNQTWKYVYNVHSSAVNNKNQWCIKYSWFLSTYFSCTYSTMYLVVVTKIVFESKSLLLNNNIALFKIIRFMLDEMRLEFAILFWKS